MPLLDLVREGPVAVLTINRDEKRNALHGPLWAALRESATELTGEPPAVLIVTGAGDHFCAGMDLSMENPVVQRLVPVVAGRDLAGAAALISDLKATMEAFAAIPCPTIAAVEGACAGGGLELALALDVVVASRTAFFSMPETHRGMVPDLGGTVRLLRRVGRARASDLILTGRRISAVEAHAWGLAERLVETGAALDGARALAEQMLGSAPEATRQVLRVLRGAEGWTDHQAYTAETEAGAAAICSGEVLEGVQSFMEKRAPRWDR